MVGMCWSMVFVSVENLFRMLPRGVVSNSLEQRRKKANLKLLTTFKRTITANQINYYDEHSSVISFILVCNLSFIQFILWLYDKTFPSKNHILI